ncbi:MAG: ABC transporter substrate-binding protein [Actinobacteria bacterium]|nr:ABC transporter substrate-binding protein [Actinomycetota bacterium]
MLALTLAACGSDDTGGSEGDGDGTDTPTTGDTEAGGSDGRTIKIGYVSPQTGALAAFGEADSFVVDAINQHLGEGIDIGGANHPVEILVRDSQSDPNRAAEVAADLILSDEVDLVLVASTPETTNPVSDQCEVNSMPCISTVAPWQPWLLGRGGDPETGFEWTYHFFWGLEDIIAVFTNMWSQIETNQVVGALWPNDADGNAWGDPEVGFPSALQEQGYEIVDPGRYENGTDDFSSQISAYKNANAEIVTGVPIPPDFTTFWTQAAQQDFRPKIASVGKALLFPSAVEALGELGEGMSTEVWWSPNHPFSSSLTGQSAQELADAFEEATGQQWTQPIGFVHALFEVAVDALQRSGDIDDPAAIRDAIAATQLDTVVGPIDFSQGPANVAKTPLVGGQWKAGEEHRYELVIVSNETAPDIPTGGELEPLPGS